ncbi:MAG: BMP family ABC transporter substrate-binding protein [Oscillospiraceae bacterium]|nr:BMP family ABC transporter substrate-binding protein [Oscillospiraceae bacterium]
MKIKKFLALFLTGILLISGCGGGATIDPGIFINEGEVSPYPLDMKVGFIYSGSVGSDPMIATFESCRYQLEVTLKSVKTSCMENVLLQQFEQAVEAYIDNGYNVIVAADAKYNSAVVISAKKHQDIAFISFGGHDIAHNLSSVQPLLYQAANVLGFAAAYNTVSNKIGLVIDPNMYNAYGIANAFALGTRELPNSQTNLSVKWALSNNFADTKRAVDEFYAQGCDIVFVYQYEEYGIKRCEELGINVMACAFNLPEIAPEHYLTGMFLNLDTYLINEVRKVQYGNFVFGELTREGLFYPSVSMVQLNENTCKEGTKEIMDKLMNLIYEGKTPIFGGEVRDRNGDVRIAKGDHWKSPQVLQLRAWLTNLITSEQNMSAPLTEDDLIYSDLKMKD